MGDAGLKTQNFTRMYELISALMPPRDFENFLKVKFSSLVHPKSLTFHQLLMFEVNSGPGYAKLYVMTINVSNDVFVVVYARILSTTML